jgi:hypothetical protein
MFGGQMRFATRVLHLVDGRFRSIDRQLELLSILVVGCL